MGREEYTKEKKEKISEKINTKINEIAKLKKSYSENLDIFEAVNDEIKDLFECDLNCYTCGPDDRGKCMQNFRLANIFLQRQCRILVVTIDNYLELFDNILKDLGYDILEELKPKEEKEPSDKHYYS